MWVCLFVTTENCNYVGHKVPRSLTTFKGSLSGYYKSKVFANACILWQPHKHTKFTIGCKTWAENERVNIFEYWGYIKFKSWFAYSLVVDNYETC